jgi:hypothetical protein
MVTDAEIRAYPELKKRDITGICAAYPGREPGQTDAIPLSIWIGQHDHRQPLNDPWDNGIHFEAKSEEDAEYAALLFDRE